jgi:hypothetical protein
LDYYEYGGVTPIPQAYQASPTAESLRDLLIAIGIMDSAPAAEIGVPWQDDPDNNGVFQDDPTVNAVFQDHTT